MNVPSSSAGTVVVLNRDLMFGVQIRNVLHTHGYGAAFVPDTAALVARLAADAAESGSNGSTTSPLPPVLGILDMNGPVDWDLVRGYVDGVSPRVPLLAFGPHVDATGRRAAKAAGVDRIVSNGEFHRSMGELVRRYALATGS